MSTTTQQPSPNPHHETFAVGIGCYWGTEHYLKSPKYFQKHFPGAIIDIQVGFMGGDVVNPTYRQVCDGKTNHVEVANIVFDNTKCDLLDLLQYSFALHDPTTMNRQGGDTGTQYASAIFVQNADQQKKAELVKNAVQKAIDDGKTAGFKRGKYEGTTVTTAIRPYSTFYPAHAEHQQYLENNPDGYCNHFLRYQPFDGEVFQSTAEMKELLKQQQQ